MTRNVIGTFIKKGMSLGHFIKNDETFIFPKRNLFKQSLCRKLNLYEFSTIIFVSNIHTKASISTSFIRLPDLFLDKCQGSPSRILNCFWKISSSILNLLIFMEYIVGAIILELLETDSGKTNTVQHTD